MNTSGITVVRKGKRYGEASITVKTNDGIELSASGCNASISIVPKDGIVRNYTMDGLTLIKGKKKLKVATDYWTPETETKHMMIMERLKTEIPERNQLLLQHRDLTITIVSFLWYNPHDENRKEADKPWLWCRSMCRLFLCLKHSSNSGSHGYFPAMLVNGRSSAVEIAKLLRFVSPKTIKLDVTLAKLAKAWTMLETAGLPRCVQTYILQPTDIIAHEKDVVIRSMISHLFGKTMTVQIVGMPDMDTIDFIKDLQLALLVSNKDATLVVQGSITNSPVCGYPECNAFGWVTQCSYKFCGTYCIKHAKPIAWKKCDMCGTSFHTRCLTDMHHELKWEDRCNRVKNPHACLRSHLMVCDMTCLMRRFPKYKGELKCRPCEAEGKQTSSAAVVPLAASVDMLLRCKSTSVCNTTNTMYCGNHQCVNRVCRGHIHGKVSGHSSDDDDDDEGNEENVGENVGDHTDDE